jgi:rhodanese-related sulfurtransferase
MHLPHHTVVYPAHGPGSLCGKNMSPDLQSTIGRELRENYALQLMDELQFIKTLTTDQPFVPKYFGWDVEMNKKGAPIFDESVKNIPRLDDGTILDRNILVIDTRPKALFIKGHLQGAINLQNGGKLETWLGSVVGPDEKFYLVAESDEELDTVIKKAAKIGYETNVRAGILHPYDQSETSAKLDETAFTHHPDQYTIIDVRNTSEVQEGLVFGNAIPIPLPELRERLGEIPTGKPIVVHCAAGYRSAAASSIIAAEIKSVPVYDLGEAIVDIAKSKSIAL